MHCCSSAILIYKGTREVFAKISRIPLGMLNVPENIAKLTLDPATQHSELHNDSSREVTEVGMQVSFYRKTVLKSQGALTTLASHREHQRGSGVSFRRSCDSIMHILLTNDLEAVRKLVEEKNT